MAEHKKVKVAHASFWYTGENGRHRVALRGDEIEVGADDYARGKAHDAFEAKASKPEPDGNGPSVKEILEEVGDDKEKALAALAAERESRGDKARKTLVEPLEAIIKADA